MKINFKWLQAPEIKNLIKALTISNKLTFKFVGGCVRDSILGSTPKDFDIASTLLPLENIELLKAHNIKVIPLAIDYGTIIAVINNYKFEITTLRKDIKNYGRKADVKFTTSFKEDALRRDFTINALYLDPNSVEITDYFNGINDLKKGNITFIKDSKQRINEDYLRILRFVRFYTYYGKNKITMLEKQILKSNVSKLLNLSKERINLELQKIIIHKNATKGIKLLNNLGISLLLFKQEKLNYTALSKLKLLAEHHNITIPYILTWLALLNKQITIAEIALQLNLTREEKKLIKVQLHLQKILKLYPKVSYLLAQFDYKTTLYSVLLLLAKSKKGHKNYIYCINLLLAIKQQENFKFPIKGNDLIKLGAIANKSLGKLLVQLKEWGIENNIKNKQIYLNKTKQLIDATKG